MVSSLLFLGGGLSTVAVVVAEPTPSVTPVPTSQETPGPTPAMTKSVVCLQVDALSKYYYPVTLDRDGNVASYSASYMTRTGCLIKDWSKQAIRLTCGCEPPTWGGNGYYNGYNLGPDYWCNTGKAYFNANPPNRECTSAPTPMPPDEPTDEPTPEPTTPAPTNLPTPALTPSQTTLAPTTTQQPSQCLTATEDVDYPGNDIAQTNRANHADCCNDCAKTVGCDLYVWTPWNGGTCFLKSSPNTVGGDKPYPGARSARISQGQQSQCSDVVDGVDYPGNDLTETNRANHADCCNDCVATPGCAAYVWTSWNDGTCFLKSKAGDAQPKQGAKAATLIPKSSPTPTPTTIAPSKCYGFKKDMDFPGNDITQTSQADHRDCCNDCANTLFCDLYVWTPWNNGTCFLKSSTKGSSEGTPYPGAWSATIQTPYKKLPPPPPEFQLCTQPEPDDFPGNDIALTNRTNYMDCCGDCTNTPNCAGYVWKDDVCYLKSKFENYQSSSKALAGLRRVCAPQQVDTDYSDKDVAVVPGSTQDCCGLCMRTKRCIGYTHFNGICYLKESFIYSYKKIGATSGLAY
ncbi:unnamed protein product [Aphanomyces euteiches]